jgi:hypothetical protein
VCTHHDVRRIGLWRPATRAAVPRNRLRCDTNAAPMDAVARASLMGHLQRERPRVIVTGKTSPIKLTQSTGAPLPAISPPRQPVVMPVAELVLGESNKYTSTTPLPQAKITASRMAYHLHCLIRSCHPATARRLSARPRRCLHPSECSWRQHTYLN